MLLLTSVACLRVEFSVRREGRDHALRAFRTSVPCLVFCRRTLQNLLELFGARPSFFEIFCCKIHRLPEASVRKLARAMLRSPTALRMLYDVRGSNEMLWELIANAHGAKGYPLHLSEVGPLLLEGQEDRVLYLLKELARDPKLWVNWTSCEFCRAIRPASLRRWLAADPSIFQIVLQPECMAEMVMLNPGSAYSLARQHVDRNEHWMIETLQSIGDPAKLSMEGFLRLEMNTKKISGHALVFWTMRFLQLRILVEEPDRSGIRSVIAKARGLIAGSAAVLCPFAVKQLSTAITWSSRDENRKAWGVILSDLYAGSGPFLRKTLFYSEPHYETPVAPLQDRLEWIRISARDTQEHLEIMDEERLLRLLKSKGATAEGTWYPRPGAQLEQICNQVYAHYCFERPFPVIWDRESFKDKLARVFLSKDDPCAALRGPHSGWAGLSNDQIYQEFFPQAIS